MTRSATRLGSAVEIAAAFVAHNKLGHEKVADLVVSIFVSLGANGTADPAAEPQSKGHPTPAMIRKSIGLETLISFEDGKPYRTLKRHLSSRGLTPGAYRIKWGLPEDYPMVAPGYRTARSEIARRIGLGRTPVRRAVASPTPKAEAGDRSARRPKSATVRASTPQGAKAPIAAPRGRGRPPKGEPNKASVAKSAKPRAQPGKGSVGPRLNAPKALAKPATMSRTGSPKTSKPKPGKPTTGKLETVKPRRGR